MRLTEDRVLPSQCYQPLMDLLLESVQGPAEVGVVAGAATWVLGPGCSSPPAEPGPARRLWGLRSPVGSLVPAQEDTTSPLAVLEELASGDCRQDLATKLVKLFLGQGLAGSFLDYLTRREVARTSEFPTHTNALPQGQACRGSPGRSEIP